MAALPRSVSGLFADPGTDCRLVSVSIPRPGRGRLRCSRHVVGRRPRGDPGVQLRLLLVGEPAAGRFPGGVTLPPPQSLGDGIHLIPAPLPFKAPPWVKTYAVEADGGLLLIDCGTDWEPGRTALAKGFTELGLDESAVHTLVVSHLHPDHVGMSSRLVRELGCRFVMHERASILVDRYNDTPGYAKRLAGIAH